MATSIKAIYLVDISKCRWKIACRYFASNDHIADIKISFVQFYKIFRQNLSFIMFVTFTEYCIKSWATVCFQNNLLIKCPSKITQKVFFLQIVIQLYKVVMFFPVKILITTEPISLFVSGKVYTGHRVAWGYFFIQN